MDEEFDATDLVFEETERANKRRYGIALICLSVCICIILLFCTLGLVLGIVYGVSDSSSSDEESNDDSMHSDSSSYMESNDETEYQSSESSSDEDDSMNSLYSPSSGPIIYSTFLMNNQRTNMISSPNNAPPNTSWTSDMDPNRAVPTTQGLLVGSVLSRKTLAAFDMKDGSVVSEISPEEANVYDFRDILMAPKSDSEDYGIIISTRCELGLFLVRKDGIEWLTSVPIEGLSSPCYDAVLAADFQHLYIQSQYFDVISSYNIADNIVEWTYEDGLSHPVVLHDKIIGIAIQFDDSGDDLNYMIVAVDLYSGSNLWTIHNYPATLVATCSKFSVPTSETVFYIVATGKGCHDHHCDLDLYCYETSTGIQLWTSSLDPFMYPTHGAIPIIFIIESPVEHPTLDHLIITGNYDYVYAYSPAGYRLWSVQTGNLILAITSNNQILLANGNILSQSGTIVSTNEFEKRDGGVLDDNLNFFYFGYADPFGCA